MNQTTTYLLPLTATDLAYLSDALQGRAELRVPDKRDLARTLLHSERALPADAYEQVEEQIKAGFEDAVSEATANKEHAIALRSLIAEAKRRPSEFSL
jgi:hypothetical protein